MNYCVVHQKNCFDHSSSTSCRRQNEFTEKKSNTNIADFYVPEKIVSHRVVKGGGSAPQLQFRVEWKPGWTENKKLGKVIRSHPLQKSLFLIDYTPSWEPLI